MSLESDRKTLKCHERPTTQNKTTKLPNPNNQGSKLTAPGKKVEKRLKSEGRIKQCRISI